MGNGVKDSVGAGLDVADALDEESVRRDSCPISILRALYFLNGIHPDADLIHACQLCIERLHVQGPVESARCSWFHLCLQFEYSPSSPRFHPLRFVKLVPKSVVESAKNIAKRHWYYTHSRGNFDRICLFKYSKRV
jgi:hypothetical protein